MFQGFSTETNDFLWGIRFNNERSWFQAHKQEYTDYVLAPMQALAEEVYDRVIQAHPDLELIMRVSRIYRDARRLRGRGPYKSSLWFTLRSAGENWSRLPAFWYGVRAESYGGGLGIYDATPALMARLRREIDENPAEITRLATAFAGQDKFQLGGEEYKRPKGHPQPPLDQWYNRKGLELSYAREPGGLLYQPGLAQAVAEDFEFLFPYYQYFHRLCLRTD